MSNFTYFVSIFPHLKVAIAMTITENSPRHVRMMYVCFIVY